VDHSTVGLHNIGERRKELLAYMRQNIYLLGWVELKAQDIYRSEYNIDITTKITLPSLALSIFRLKYYDPNKTPIGIPNKNADTFIRRGYYGGHSDVYKPREGANLYYSDVNSLYPFAMKEFALPATWRGSLRGKKLENLFGFIES
jgi:hypothetical protein